MIVPSLSVIVPVYNSAKYLTRCIDSVCALDDISWEMILVDDGSSDMSGSICDRYSEMDNRIMTVHQSNRGVSSARNLGLDMMSGEYLMFLDSDDWVDAEMVRFSLSEMIKLQADLLQSPTTRIKNVDGDSIVRGPIQCELYDANEYVRRNHYSLCIGGNIMRSDIIQKQRIRFRENIRLAEDQIFLMDYMRSAKSICNSESAFYKYYDCESSATNNSKSDLMLCSCTALISYKELYPIFSNSIDYTLLYFIWYIIKNNDVSNRRLSNIIKSSNLSYSHKCSTLEKLFISISNVAPQLGIWLVRYYMRIKK